MTATRTSRSDEPVLRLRAATLRFGDRELWSNLNLEVQPGEFLAVLGPNGSGKTSLVKTLLGQQRLTSGDVELFGRTVKNGHRRIGYIPQQRVLDDGTPLRARDLVALGVDGHRWGLPRSSRAVRREVDAALKTVGASHYAKTPVGTLSGGEQQRIRVAQSIVGDPGLLLCDEPLSSLDLHHQKVISELVNEQAKARGASVIFVTHDVNPILGMVDRVLYLAGGRFRVGTPDEVLRSEVLSYMYDTPVEVIRSRGRVAVLGAPEGYGVHDHLEHHLPDRRPQL
jgi:zinc/manganese transport system ATP-binding protein